MSVFVCVNIILVGILIGLFISYKVIAECATQIQDAVKEEAVKQRERLELEQMMIELEKERKEKEEEEKAKQDEYEQKMRQYNRVIGDVVGFSISCEWFTSKGDLKASSYYMNEDTDYLEDLLRVEVLYKGTVMVLFIIGDQGKQEIHHTLVFTEASKIVRKLRFPLTDALQEYRGRPVLMDFIPDKYIQIS